MSAITFPKRAFIDWDEQRVLALLSEPEQLLSEEPWSSWLVQQGGLTSVHDSLRNLPLAEKQRRTLAAILDEPGASLQKYALRMSVSVATYVRYRAALVKTLVAVLNAHLLDKQPARSDVTRVISGARTNLPYQHMPLIGRDAELEQVQRLLLGEGVSLLTITGPGGIGKTRLALQVAANLLGDFEDGAFFVSLASINSPDLVVGAVLQALELKPGDGRSAAETLKEYLGGRQVLLVLDNFEHVMPAAPLIGDILAAAAHVRILVTSTMVLHLYGEHEFALPPLSVPNLRDLPAPPDLARSPAVALFLSRVRAVKPEFELTPANSVSVAGIVVQLEGLPLALELAAARIKLFAPESLLQMINHRLTLAAQRASDRPARHQTLRSAISWSYQLLEPDEQALFAQLGVFAGGCTLEAVGAVCAWEEPGHAPLLEQLGSLVDKSMLQHELRANGEPRFMLLETLREFALEQLGAEGQTQSVRRRHLAYYRRFVEGIEPGPRAPNLRAWMNRLEEEHDNLRAALQWAIENGQVDSALCIAGAVWRFWQIHGHVEEGRRWMKAVLAMPAGDRSVQRAKALWGAGWLGMVLSDLDQSGKYFEEGAAISRASGDHRYLGLALHGIGAVARAQGDFGRSREALEESLPLFDGPEDAEDLAWTFEHLGVTALEEGQFEQAVSFLSKGLGLFRSLDQRWACAEALTFLGHAAFEHGQASRAEASYLEALEIYEELEDKFSIATINSYLGAMLYGHGDDERALGLLKKNLAASHGLKNYWGLAWGVERLAEVAEKTGSDERAARLWGAARSLRRLTGVLWHPGFHSFHGQKQFAALKERLGSTRWEQLWAEGESMSVDRAVAFALET